MSVWDEHTAGDGSRAVVPRAARGSSDLTVEQRRVHDDVRAAAQRDAAEIVARARHDIRRIVSEARRELLELSAQVQAVDVELPGSADLDPAELASALGPVVAEFSESASYPPVPAASLEARARVDRSGDVAVQEQDAWPSVGPAPTPVAIDPDRSHSVFGHDGRFQHPSGDDSLGIQMGGFGSAPTPSSAKAFVALFTLAGVVVAGGTAWWLTRTPPAAPASAAVALASPVAESSSRDDSAAPTPAEAPDVPPLAAAEPLSGGPEIPAGIATATEVPGRAANQPSAAPALRAQGPAPTAVPAVLPPGTAITPATPPAAAAVPAPVQRPPAPSVPTAVPAPVAENPSPPQPVATAPPPAPPARLALPGRIDISTSSRQWLDAYHRQDQGTMAPLDAPSIAINDQRRTDQRFPFGLEVTRAFDDEQLQLSGDSALFTARMTERAATAAVVSRVWQTWIRRQGLWQLQEARISYESGTVSAPR